MQINRLLADPTGASGGVLPLTAASAQAAAVLHARGGTPDLGQQLQAYQSLAGQWREARHFGQRAALAQALTESPFGQRVNTVLNTFTRAAWAGVDAVPPQPQIQVLNAFDELSGDDQRIVATLTPDPATGVGFVTATDYRETLQAAVDAAQSGTVQRQPDRVTLSVEAQARLAGDAPSDPVSSAADDAVNPQLAKVLAAYLKAAG